MMDSLGRIPFNDLPESVRLKLLELNFALCDMDTFEGVQITFDYLYGEQAPKIDVRYPRETR